MIPASVSHLKTMLVLLLSSFSILGTRVFSLRKDPIIFSSTMGSVFTSLSANDSVWVPIALPLFFLVMVLPPLFCPCGIIITFSWAVCFVLLGDSIARFVLVGINKFISEVSDSSPELLGLGFSYSVCVFFLILLWWGDVSAILKFRFVLGAVYMPVDVLGAENRSNV